MFISTEIASIAARVGSEKEALRLVAGAGFEAYDLSLFQLAKYDYSVGDVVDRGHPMGGDRAIAYIGELRKYADELGLVCNQSHAPFPVACPAIREKLKRAIECTAIAGGKICIIHPNNNLSAEENAVMYRELLPTAHDFGVKIAAENMWCWNRELDHAARAACSHHDDFVKHIDVVNDPYLVACLDIGHAEMQGLQTSAREMILSLGHRIEALHLHDNDRKHDNHRVPFTADIDFDDVISALAEIDYCGDITLEADRHLAEHPDRSAEDCVRDMYDAGVKLRQMLLNAKKDQ